MVCFYCQNMLPGFILEGFASFAVIKGFHTTLPSEFCYNVNVNKRCLYSSQAPNIESGDVSPPILLSNTIATECVAIYINVPFVTGQLLSVTCFSIESAAIACVNHWWDNIYHYKPRCKCEFCFKLVLCSLSERTFYHYISWSLEAAIFGFKPFRSLWNLSGTSAADGCQISERYDPYNI